MKRAKTESQPKLELAPALKIARLLLDHYYTTTIRWKLALSQPKLELGPALKTSLIQFFAAGPQKGTPREK